MANPSKTNSSLLIGAWLGLTCLVGVSVFGVVFLLMGGLNNASAPLPTPAVSRATATAAIPTPLPTAPALVENTPKSQPACNLLPLPASGFGYGIQSHVFVGENDYWLSLVNGRLGLQWVKIQVRWQDIESGEEGHYFWDVLDGAMNEACKNGLHVLFSVVAAPHWAIGNPLPAPEGQEAPPDDPQKYANFVAALIDRYPGRIGAIEVWNEMNLEREWNTASGVNPAEYVKLLAVTYNTIKAKDASIIVISGAPAPTGFNCKGVFPNCQPEGRTIVMDDATYLREFINTGGLNYADCIGTHSNGSNLPPDADGAHPPDKTGYTFIGPWDNPHYSWALRSQIETYATILQNTKPQCVTEFGYASPVNGQSPNGYGFAADVSEQKQAEYIVGAYNWMRDSGKVKMAFLFNLDYGPKGGDPASDDNVIFCILNKDGAPRPAFDAISAMPKP
jgi:hypothetical protein